MKRALVLVTLSILCGSPCCADPILSVDSAPNAYGSPAWAPWWGQAKADVAAGTFTNLRTGTYPGTHSIDPYDEIVYSTGDLGKRVHWIYWVSNTSTTTLDGLFEVKWVIDWAGSEWTYEGGGWAANGADVGWTQPSSWEDYNGGVIGSLGFAWWATDNDAPPFDTGGNPYDEADQADIDALRQSVLANQTFAKGCIRWRADANSDWETSCLQLAVVPLPGAALLGFLGLSASTIALRRRRQKD